MNTLSKGCLRLSFAFLNNSAFFLRPYCPAVIRPERFCSRHFDFQNVPQNQLDDFEDSCPGHELFEDVDFDSIVGDDLQMKKKLQIIILELSMKLQTETLLAPKKLKSQEWQNLLNCKTDTNRERYLQYLYVREKRKETYELLKSDRKEDFEKLEKRKYLGPLTTSSPMDYCLSGTTLFHRVCGGVVLKKFNFSLALAMMFGEDLIIDCSYEEFMTQSGINSCGRHISYLYSNNRLSKNPFNLVLCNVDKNSRLMKVLTQTFSNFNKGEYFITVTEKHYLDLYPAEKLIYMTPHCFNDMEKYEEDSVYILGAYVDVGKYKPISAAKAKKNEIRTARLPLDKYLNWSQGSKLLPFNVCARVLNEIKDGACWQYALRHLDVRKQKFQFFDNDIDIEKQQKLTAMSVREEARRHMLYELKIKGNRIHRKNVTECSPSKVDDNERQYSANDEF